MRNERGPLTARAGVRLPVVPRRLPVGLLALVLAGPLLVGESDPGPDASERRRLGNHPQWVQAVAISADGRRLASTSFDGSVYLWDVQRASLDSVLEPGGEEKPGYLHGLAFAPDGLTLAAGDLDGNVILWDLAAGSRRRTSSGHDGGVTSVAFSPDGRTIAVARLSGRIELWDIAGGLLRLCVARPRRGSPALASSPDGRLLASGGSDTAVRLWPVASEAR